jgi:hypothetical protein
VGKSTISGPVSAQVPNDIIAELDRRADSLSIKRGTFTVLVFEWWKAQGYPPVTRADQAMQDIRALERFKAAEDAPAPDSPGKAARKRAV